MRRYEPEDPPGMVGFQFWVVLPILGFWLFSGVFECVVGHPLVPEQIGRILYYASWWVSVGGTLLIFLIRVVGLTLRELARAVMLLAAPGVAILIGKGILGLISK